MAFTPEQAREQFSALCQTYQGKPVTFFDGPGGTQIPLSVLESMIDYLGHYNANLGGHYFSSKKTTSLVQQARESVQALLNASAPETIIFGANMTSLTFQLSRAISRDWQAGDEVIVTALDHYSNVSSWQQAAADKQVTVHQVPINPQDCSLNIDRLFSLLNEKTKLIAVTYASNTTGTIVNVKRIIDAAHQMGVLVYVDAVHYAPHHLIDVQDLDCDFLTCSAYKFFAPHVGIAYISPQWVQKLRPYKVEPATNIGPGRFETGTLSFEGLAGLIAAIEYLAQFGTIGAPLRQRLQESYAQYNRHEEELSRYFLAKLDELKDVTLHGLAQPDAALRTPTFALTFKNASPETIAKILGEHNICVGNGNFYALGLIKQLGLEASGGVVRIGLLHYNTKQEIDHLFEILTHINE